jgi:hypothetical protein
VPNQVLQALSVHKMRLIVANGDILLAKVVENTSIKAEHGYVNLTGVLHVPGLD